MEIAPLFPAPPTKSTGTGDTARITNTFDDFLLLLTTQLTNQDPLSPMEPSEFTNQLVQFSIVEQEIKSNDALKNLTALMESDRALNVASMLGATVEAVGDFAPLSDGQAEFGYVLERSSDSTLIRIFDNTGKLVRSDVGAVSAGSHSYVWDGEDDDGDAMPEGQYRISVAAADSDGPIDVSTTAVGEVTGVRMSAEGMLLSLHGTEVGLDRVLGLRRTIAPTS